MFKNLQAVILAGGKGSRLKALGRKIPKAMVPISGIPFINLLIKQLKKNGINKFLILTGYKKNLIIDYFKNRNNIKIFSGNVNWQTLTRIVKAKSKIDDFFLLMYCDNYLINYNLKKQIKFAKKNKSKVTFCLVKKKWGQKGTIISKNTKVYYKKGISSDYSEAGYILIDKKFFFKSISKFYKSDNKLSNYLGFLSKRFNLYGIDYNNKFLCIENKILLQKTKKYFKNKSI